MAGTGKKQPQAPKGLGNEGRRFWRQVTQEWRFRPDELRILERAARLLDTLAALDEALDGADLIMAGSRGNLIANPLLTERRLHEETLARLLRQLGLPDEDDDADRSNRSSAARSLAMARWRKGA